MFSKINHVAIVSENYAVLEQFYRAVFGMTPSAKTRPGRAVTVGDGYAGLNINPRRAGRRPGLDHFGIEVADAEAAFDRMRRNYPEVKWLKRPSNRPFAGVSTHDPDGKSPSNCSVSEVEMNDHPYLFRRNGSRPAIRVPVSPTANWISNPAMGATSTRFSPRHSAGRP